MFDIFSDESSGDDCSSHSISANFEDPTLAMPSNVAAHNPKAKGYFYSMSGHCEKCVEKYCELAKVSALSLKKVATPCLSDHQIPVDELTVKGRLASVCSRIVLKILFFARIARPGLLSSVNMLAREVT